ncbi:MAG TPA: DUF72 domain-containing protein [Pyrinomonadaceae bacterium]|nr:DUF72 domain-containing protein [Pyrinomonadaceae bacterium]
MKIKVGTSGFGIAQAKYTQLFSCVEVQHTFYQPPKISTLERWRAAAPPDFEFVLKAWQLITHDARSPTYRRLKKKLTALQREEAGYFRLTPIVEEAWETTLASAVALRARTILFQCPASFKQTKENIANLKNFFRSIVRPVNIPNLNFAWEPRGDWNLTVVKRICEDLNLWHAVDPFTATSVTPDKIYFRLHGRSGWRYEYDEEELCELAAILIRQATEPRLVGVSNSLTNIVAPYVFFNNARMTTDALRFRSIAEEGASE